MLLGPLRALDYFFSHGLLAVVLGAIWHWKSHWSISLVVGAVTRLVGLLGYFYITAWMLKEDLFSLLLNNVYSLLVRYASQPLETFTDSMHVSDVHAFVWEVDSGMLLSLLIRSSSFWVSVACLLALCCAHRL